MKINRTSFLKKFAGILGASLLAPKAVSALVQEAKERKVATQTKVEMKKLDDFYTKQEFDSFGFSGTYCMSGSYPTHFCSGFIFSG